MVTYYKIGDAFCASDQVYTLIFKYFPDENHSDAVEAYEKTLPENAVFHLLGSGVRTVPLERLRRLGFT